MFAHPRAADLGSDAVGLSGGREVEDQDEVRGINPEYSGGARARVDDAWQEVAERLPSRR